MVLLAVNEGRPCNKQGDGSVVEVECNFVEDLDKDILERELNS
jgi:hypothetical protein